LPNYHTHFPKANSFKLSISFQKFPRKLLSLFAIHWLDGKKIGGFSQELHGYHHNADDGRRRAAVNEFSL